MNPPFTIQKRVEFGDTDMAGIAYFPNFFRYMETAETNLLHTLGISVSWKEGDTRYGFPRVSVSCDYKSPARFEDILDIRVIVEEIGRKSIRYRFEFFRQEQPIAVGRITTVFCRNDANHQMISCEIPHWLREKLQPHLEGENHKSQT